MAVRHRRVPLGSSQDAPAAGASVGKHPVPPGRWMPGQRDGEGISSLFDEIATFLRSHPADPTPRTAGAGGPSELRVLLPYSGSDAADRAVTALVQLAPSLRAEVRVLHVREFDTCRGARFFLESQREALELVHSAVSRLRRRGLAATGVVRTARWGHAPTAIVDEADRSAVSMILLGTHRRRSLLDRVRPNVVRRVLRQASCAVLVVGTDPPPGVTRRGARRGGGSGPGVSRAA